MSRQGAPETSQFAAQIRSHTHWSSKTGMLEQTHSRSRYRRHRTSSGLNAIGYKSTASSRQHGIVTGESPFDDSRSAKHEKGVAGPRPSDAGKTIILELQNRYDRIVECALLPYSVRADGAVTHRR